MTQERTTVNPPVGIAYKDNFKNFFQMTIFFLAYVVTFLGQLHFTRNYFFTVNTSAQQLLLQSNQFDTTVTFSEQLLFWNSYFFRRLTSSQQLLFQNSYLFGAKVLPTTSINSSSLGQLVFQNSYFRKRNLFRISISINCLRKNTPSQMFQGVLNLCFQNSRFFNKVTCSKETFSKQLLFQKCYSFRKAIERKIYFFRADSF